MQRPTGASPNTSAFAGPQAGQAGFNTSATIDFSAVPEEVKAKWLNSFKKYPSM
jgi:hypothetical protein